VFFALMQKQMGEVVITVVYFTTFTALELPSL